MNTHFNFPRVNLVPVAFSASRLSPNISRFVEDVFLGDPLPGRGMTYLDPRAKMRGSSFGRFSLPTQVQFQFLFLCHFNSLYRQTVSVPWAASPALRGEPVCAPWFRQLLQYGYRQAVVASVRLRKMG